MDRYWFLTNTCYGQWLPGDPRGFVGQVWEHRRGDPAVRRRVRHSIPQTDYDARLLGLHQAAASALKSPPVELQLPHAEALIAQFLETATFRRWEIFAAAIMSNHFHLVVGVPGDPAPSKILADFKAWGTRTLNEQFGKPSSETWWTHNGSKRKLPHEQAILDARHYVLYKQPDPLITWSPETGLCYGIPPNTSQS